MIVLEDPVPLTEFGTKRILLAEYLSSDWGITLNNDIVIDTQAPSSAYYATAVQYTAHPITDKMGGIGVTFPYARSISVSLDLQDITVTDLYYTTEAGMGRNRLRKH